MITRAQVHQAIDDGILEAVKDRAKMGTVTILSEKGDIEQGQFTAGLVKLREALELEHAVVDAIFPE